MGAWCQSCSTELNYKPADIVGRTDTCPKCGVDVHACVQCTHHDPKAYNSVVYATSKGALVNFTRDLAVKWAQHGIRVNCICPGFFVTPLNQKLYERNRETIDSRIPLGHTGGPDDLKGIAVLLASDASAFITGAIIPVDGGTIAW